MERSITEYFYERSGPKGHKCGYCKSKDTSVSHGMWTHFLTVDDYQDLIDRGWRRSGKYCYKPLMSSTCCPAYTISCDATKFRISRSQKRCANAVVKYLTLGECSSSKGHQAAEASGASEKIPSSSKNLESVSKKSKAVRPGEGADPSKPPCRKSKVIRMEKKAKKLEDAAVNTDARRESSSKDDQSAKGKEKELLQKAATPEFLKVGKDGKKPVESFLQIPESAAKPYAHKLEIKLVKSSPPSKEFKDTFIESFHLYKKYQITVHKDKEDEVKESSYRRFLCDSPLIPKRGQDGWPCDYGSYHQQYRIDGKLIAVGVVDILPKCVSSVYSFFDMDYDFLSLGVYSALREIEMTRKLHMGNPEKFKFYYMGYYIHSCPKMRYKGNYFPSYLLCPESYTFMPIDACLPKLDSAKYSRLCDLDTPPENVLDWLGETLVLVHRTAVPFSFLSSLPSADEEKEKVKEYSSLIGPKVARRMLLALNL